MPDVYQLSIYAIDYQQLKDAGIKLISFDIDDTVADLMAPEPPKTAIALFKNLKRMGFEIMLLSNAWDTRAENYAEKLGIKDRYIPRAEKPFTTHFQAMQDQCRVEKNQMAHVGNSMMEDVAGGNAFGITTCLVRRVRVTGGLPKRIPGVKTQGQKLRKELKKRGIWRKHHKENPNDQYYQLGEIPEYKRTQDIAEIASTNLRIQVEAEKDVTSTLDEGIRNPHMVNKNEGMETLRKHLGEGIVFTGMWADARDKRELEKTELSNGEMSGCVFTIGCYTIRSTLCLYRDDGAVNYYQKVPAGPNDIAAYLKRKSEQQGMAFSLFGQAGEGLREVQVISAKHRDATDWQEVCMATAAVGSFWYEDILFFCTVKYDASASDCQEMLFVLKRYFGDSFGVSYWYKLLSDGTVTEYSEHQLNPESFEESWRETS